VTEAISQNPELLIFSVVLQNVLFFVVTVGVFWAGTFVLRLLRGKNASGYGLGPLGFRKPRGGYLITVSIGVLIGFCALILSTILNAVSSLALDRLGLPADNSAQAPLMDGITGWVRESPGLAIPLAFFAVVILGPAVEELVFRGAIFGGLYRLFRLVTERGMRSMRSREGGDEYARGSSTAGKFALVLSATLSSVLFSLLHFSPVLVVALFVLALALCETYRRTGSLLAPFVAHATFNSFAVIALILTGLDLIPTQV
jgi:membrane protease YdiL (CAAX protease family)